MCPGCKRLVRCPESTIDYGLLFQKMREEDRKSSLSAAGVVCTSCRSTVDPTKCRVRDHFECYHCHKELAITADTVQRWKMFFADSKEEPPVKEFAPLDYVYVKCENCQTYHQYFTEQDKPRPCPGCQHVQSLPSVRGAPLSRAALNATGRLFEILLPGDRHAIFLLPNRGRCYVGSKDSNAVLLPLEGIAPVHCKLRMTLQGPELTRTEPEATLNVNRTPVKDSVILQPEDVVELGSDVFLKLLGNRLQSDEQLISSIQREFKDADITKGKVEFSHSGAQIIQLYWEQQREKWREYQLAATADPATV